MTKPQTYANHGRMDPIFHYVLVPIFLLNIAVTITWYVRHRPTHLHTGPWLIVMSFALPLMLALSRHYAIRNQDRIIRLEERLRIASLVTPSELIELDSLTMRQYIALRFASNPELPELARRAIRENLTSRQIKQAIAAWRPDFDRI